jgi:hypothetical protein
MTPHIDTVVDTDTRSVDEVYTAEATTTDERGTVGVPVFFSAEDIKKQGIDPSGIERLGVRVEDGFTLLVPIESEAE